MSSTRVALLLLLYIGHLGLTLADDLTFNFDPPSTLDALGIYQDDRTVVEVEIEGISCSRRHMENMTSPVPEVVTTGVITDDLEGTTMSNWVMSTEPGNLTEKQQQQVKVANLVKAARTFKTKVNLAQLRMSLEPDDVIAVNISFFTNGNGQIKPSREFHILLSNTSGINTTFEIFGTSPGTVESVISVTWTCGEEVREENATYILVLNKDPDINSQTSLRYFTVVLQLICVALCGFHLETGDLKLPSCGAVLSSYLPSQILVPLFFYIFTELLPVSTAVRAGMLTNVSSPPNVFVIPLAALCGADMGLVVMIVLAAPCLSLGIMPLWLLIMDSLDPRLNLYAIYAPFKVLLILFFVPAILLIIGMALAINFPTRVRLIQRALTPLTLITLFFSFLTDAVGASIVPFGGAGYVAVTCLIQPLVLFVGCLIAQTLFQTNYSTTKATFLLTVLNSELSSYALIKNSLHRSFWAAAIAGSSLKSLMAFVFIAIVYAIWAVLNKAGVDLDLDLEGRDRQERPESPESMETSNLESTDPYGKLSMNMLETQPLNQSMNYNV